MIVCWRAAYDFMYDMTWGPAGGLLQPTDESTLNREAKQSWCGGHYAAGKAEPDAKHARHAKRPTVRKLPVCQKPAPSNPNRWVQTPLVRYGALHPCMACVRQQAVGMPAANPKPSRWVPTL